MSVWDIATKAFSGASPEEKATWEEQAAQMKAEGKTDAEIMDFAAKQADPVAYQQERQKVKAESLSGGKQVADVMGIGFAGMKQLGGEAGAVDKAAKNVQARRQKPLDELKTRQDELRDYLKTKKLEVKTAKEDVRYQEKEAKDEERYLKTQAREDDKLATEEMRNAEKTSRLDEEMKLKYEMKKISQQNLFAQQEANRTMRQQGMDDVKRRNQEAKMADMGKRMMGPAGVMNRIGEIEMMLGESGSTVEDYMANKDKPDLPGVNVPGIGRVSFYSGEARDLESAVVSLANQLLKEQSGAAVSDQEYKRFLSGIAKGRFNSEVEMIRALDRMKRTTRKDMAQVEGSFTDEVKALYTGQTADSYPGLTAPIEDVGGAEPELQSILDKY